MSLLIGLVMLSDIAFAGTSELKSNKAMGDDISSIPTVGLNYVRENREVNKIKEKQKVKNWTPPVEEPIIAEFCYGEDKLAGSNFNAGVNFDTKLGEPVKVVADGVVIFAGYCGGYGLAIFIDHEDGLITLYTHASKVEVSEGEKVKTGDVICLAGQSGNVNRSILHFEVRKNGTPVNPRNYLKDE